MPYVLAQVSDTHIGGPVAGSGERLSGAVAAINAMTRQPDLVLLTGDLTHDGSPEQWKELRERLADLAAPWEAIPGNHDRDIAELAGHRSIVAGPLRLVLLDTSSDELTRDDAVWLDAELGAHQDDRTVIAVHQPPFETGIWWMDCVGLRGAERMEEVVRRHPQVVQVLSGHIHRAIQSSWGPCSLWVSPSTAVAVAVDLDPGHEPAESAEPPYFSLHAYLERSVVSHLVPVGESAARRLFENTAPAFVAWVRGQQAGRGTAFG